MKVIVCGAGQVGYNIARNLAGENNDVVVIDQSVELIQKVNETLDVQGLVGFASYPDVLEKAGAGDTDMIVAVTQADEVNMVACQVAHSMFSVPTKVARVRAQNYLNPLWAHLFSRDHMPIDVIISPEVEVAHAIRRRLDVPGALEVIPFADDRVRLIGVHLDENCPVINTPFRQLGELFPDLNIVVVGIIRDGKIQVPKGSDQMLPGDDVYFISDTSHVERAMVAFGHEEPATRRMVIIGGGNIGLFLAEEIEHLHPDVRIKIIDADKNRAEYIAERLHRTVVLHGDGMDPEILREANVQASEAIVAVSDDDEVNILSSLLAKREGCQRAITLVNNTTYGPLVGSIGIDVVIEPRATTVSTILQHVRRGRIRALHRLRDGIAEVIEAEAMETSDLVGKPLSEIHLPGGIVVGAIVRENEVVLPRGDSIIQAHDRVIIFTVSDMVKTVEKMFSVQLEFF